MREHKGQNPSVINWFERVSGDRVFLRTAGQRWTYGETLDEIRRRAIERVSTLWPGTDPEGVFETLGALCGGGAVLAGLGVTALTRKTHLEGMRVLDEAQGFPPLDDIHIGLFYKHARLSDAGLTGMS